MAAGVNFLKLFDADLGVNGRGVQLLMPVVVVGCVFGRGRCLAVNGSRMVHAQLGTQH